MCDIYFSNEDRLKKLYYHKQHADNVISVISTFNMTRMNTNLMSMFEKDTSMLLLLNFKNMTYIDFEFFLKAHWPFFIKSLILWMNENDLCDEYMNFLMDIDFRFAPSDNLPELFAAVNRLTRCPIFTKKLIDDLLYVIANNTMQTPWE
jgi:hypothetical protein